MWRSCAPYSSLVVCSDASPGGHGISYGRAPPDEVADWSRLADCRGCYTHLTAEASGSLDGGAPTVFTPGKRLAGGLVADCGGAAWDGDPALLPSGSRSLERVSMPLAAVRWTHVGRPGGYRHIHLEEARALRWAYEFRLRHPAELGCRSVHPVDSVAVAGAACKGRSAARCLNVEMRKLMALQLASGTAGFFPWIASGDTPRICPSAGTDCERVMCLLVVLLPRWPSDDEL